MMSVSNFRRIYGRVFIDYLGEVTPAGVLGSTDCDDSNSDVGAVPACGG